MNYDEALNFFEQDVYARGQSSMMLRIGYGDDGSTLTIGNDYVVHGDNMEVCNLMWDLETWAVEHDCQIEKQYDQPDYEELVNVKWAGK